MRLLHWVAGVTALGAIITLLNVLLVVEEEPQIEAEPDSVTSKQDVIVDKLSADAIHQLTATTGDRICAVEPSDCPYKHEDVTVGVVNAPHIRDRRADERFHVYNPLSKATEKIHTSDFTDTRNPCFVYNGTVFCMPYFFVAGISKCGTSTLYAVIKENPYVQDTYKEARFFGVSNKNTNLKFLKHYACEYYAKDAASCITAGNEEFMKNVVVGDYTPSYIWRSQHAAKQIFDRNPVARIIVIVRDPIDRTWSDYKWRNTMKKQLITEERFGEMPTLFDDAVNSTTFLFNRCFNWPKAWPLNVYNPYDTTKYDMDLDNDSRFQHGGCAYNVGLNQQAVVTDTALHLSGSLYAYFIYYWLNYFPPEQILVVVTEEMRDNKERVAFEVFDFLGLPRQMNELAEDKHADPYPIPSMFEDTRKRLQDFFRPHNKLLRALVEEKGIRVVGDLNWEAKWN